MTRSHSMEFSSGSLHQPMESNFSNRPMEFSAALYPGHAHATMFLSSRAEGLPGILPPLNIVDSLNHRHNHHLHPGRLSQEFQYQPLFSLSPLSPLSPLSRLSPLSPRSDGFAFSPLLDLNLNMQSNYATGPGDYSPSMTYADQQSAPTMPFFQAEQAPPLAPPFEQPPAPGASSPQDISSNGPQDLSSKIPSDISSNGPQDLSLNSPPDLSSNNLDNDRSNAPSDASLKNPENNLACVPVPKVSDSQLTLSGAPTITPDKINQILKEYHSPAAGMGQYIYDEGIKHGINPAMALAFYAVESSCGTKGLAVQNKSWGNVRGQGPHGYKPYDSIKESLDHWYKMIDNLYLNKFHADKIGKVVSHYAPNSDGNNESVYVHALGSLVRKWSTA